MAGILLYKSAERYYGLVIADDSIYSDMRKSLSEDKSINVIWEKENTILNNIKESTIIKNDLVSRLNKGEEVNLDKELKRLFE